MVMEGAIFEVEADDEEDAREIAHDMLLDDTEIDWRHESVEQEHIEAVVQIEE